MKIQLQITKIAIATSRNLIPKISVLTGENWIVDKFFLTFYSFSRRFYPKQIKAVSLSKTYKQEKVTKTL